MISIVEFMIVELEYVIEGTAHDYLSYFLWANTKQAKILHAKQNYKIL